MEDKDFRGLNKRKKTEAPGIKVANRLWYC